MFDTNTFYGKVLLNVYEFKLNIDDFDVAKDLKKHTKLPYFFSINNVNQYMNAIKYLGGIFDDRSIAGYFLSEFNRSCKATKRKNECSNYEMK